jgi:two-component system, OmpR family, sensor histidine kinase BaeS
VSMQAEDLKTVLMNLVGNAIKYNRDRGRVTVEANRSGAWVSIQVRDTGLGMRPESLPHVFDEFFREKRKETRDIEGNGLGLAIVKRLVERAGGKVEVASTQGQGSTFTVRLPA